MDTFVCWRKASELGSVIVALTSDDEILKNKGFSPYLSYDTEKKYISIRYVDDVVKSKWLIDEMFLDRHKIDFLVHGDDTNPIPPDRLIIFPRTPEISSSDYKKGRYSDLSIIKSIIHL